MRPTLRAIYEEELSYVWNTLRRLGIAERSIEDVAHEVFLVVHRKLGDYDPSRPIRPWLFGIAHRVASDARKRAHVSREVFDPTFDRADSGPDAEAQLALRQRRALVHRGLAALDEDQRAVVILVDIDERSAPEAAEVLGIPLNTVYSRLRRGRARLEETLRAGRPA